MTFIETIKDVFGLLPKGPMYRLDDLETHYGRYISDIKESISQLDTLLTDKRWTLLLKDPNGEVQPRHLLSEVKWSCLNTIRSWIEDEFIPKIRDFSKPDYYPPRVACRISNPCLLEGQPLYNGIACLKTAQEHAETITEILHYFLCDTRSPFEQKRSLYNGDVTPHEVCRWYIGGKHIVERNFRQANDNLTKYIAFAKQHMPR